ncbi:hypothetical protein ACDX66_02135 [Peribacillus frigoritolerans]
MNSVDGAGKVHLYTRHNNEVIAKFPELHSLDLPPGTTLNGELISTDPLGKSDFEAMISRFQSNRASTPVTFAAFDVLQHEGQSVTNLPLLDRKEILADLVPEDSALLSTVKYLEGHGAAYYDAVCGQALGVVSRYEVGKRSHSWLLNFNDGRYAGVMGLGVPPIAKPKVYQLRR